MPIGLVELPCYGAPPSTRQAILAEPVRTRQAADSAQDWRAPGAPEYLWDTDD
jgi:hypothetical protein